MKKFIGAAAVGALLIALTGCATDAGPAAGGGGDDIIVGFSQVGAESGWRTANTLDIQAAFKDAGIELKFSDAQGKQENQIQALRTFVAQGVDAIILAPVVETGWEPVLKEIKQAKIPVILVDRGVTVADNSLYTTLIASDFVECDKILGYHYDTFGLIEINHDEAKKKFFDAGKDLMLLPIGDSIDL